MRHPSGKHLSALALLLLLAVRAFCADSTPAKEQDAAINSVLRRGDTVVAATRDGIYTASIKDKAWHRADTPAAIPLMGRLVGQSPDAPMLAYYAQFDFEVFGILDDNHASSARTPPIRWDGMLVSNDGGKTWTLAAPGKYFSAVFIHPDGSIFAVEFVHSPQPPASGQAATTEKDGTKIYLYSRMLLSQDKGATWKEISTDFPSGYEDYQLFADPDHAGQVCFSAISSWHTERPNVYQADDASYHWKRYDAGTWHKEKSSNNVPYDLQLLEIQTGMTRSVVVASLGNYFDHQFKDNGGGVLVAAGIHAVAAKSAYTFRSGDPKIITVKIVDEMADRPAVKFPDNKDETMFWGLEVTAAGRPSDTGMRSAAGKSGAFLGDAGTKTVQLDASHPYERQIDISRFRDFTQPGTYKVQLSHGDGGFADGCGPFASQIIEITVTP